ncbi:MAG TPA: hypothetical protein VI754_06170 [Bacteriovoracaceae bacterium]|nr:hypothetical protein [Bacteriovoracaceae bacterium]
MAQYPNALYVNLLRKKAFDFFSNTHDALESEITIFCNKIETSSTSDTDSTGNATNTIIVITRSGT